MPITQIAFAAGFNSVRRFNEAMKEQLQLTPRDIRKSDEMVGGELRLKLFYRPPYAWEHCLRFLETRLIPELEWVSGDTYYRTIAYSDASNKPLDVSKGYFSIRNQAKSNCLELSLHIDRYKHLNLITQRIKMLFDVDAPIDRIDQQLSNELGGSFNYLKGLRVPGIWGNFEAGMRAILGQQVTVAQAKTLVTLCVENLGQELTTSSLGVKKLFPEPQTVCDHSLNFLRMPQARKDTVRRLAEYFVNAKDPDNIDDWLDIKGIGPWTVNYVKIRGSKDPDVFLGGDSGINNALKKIGGSLDTQELKPWRSYLTFQLWNQLV